MAIDTTRTPMVVQMEKKSCITADDDPLCCEIYVSWCSGQISKYGKSNDPADADEATASPWIKSEYYGDIYNENTDCGSVGDEKLHHSRWWSSLLRDLCLLM
jgi:hypothetical protein